MTDRHTRLSELMQARRLELGMKTWRALAAEADIAYETLRALRTGAPIAPGTANAIEKALSWTPGSIDAVLDGGEPTTTVYGSATIGGGQLKMTARGTASFDPPEESEDDDEKMQRATALLAEAQELLAEIRRERREGA